MPDESRDIEQPESTHQFDPFSGQNNEVVEQQPVNTYATPSVTQVPSNQPMGSVPTEGTSNNLVQPIPASPAEGSVDVTVNPVFSPIQDTAAPQSIMNNNSRLPNWLKNKKLVIGITAVVLVILIAGGLTLAYTSWYQNPKKVIADSLINVLTAKTSIYTGVINVDDSTSNTKVKVNITGEQADATGSLKADVSVTAGDKKFEVSGDALVDKVGDIYFKVGGLGALVAEAKTTYGISSGSQISTSIDKVVKKIDGTWIRISSDDLKQFSEGYSTTKTCINNATKKFKDDKAAISEVTDLYVKNPFVAVDKDLGQKDGSFVYQIKEDRTALKSFVKGLKDTKIYKSLHDCDNSFTVNESDISSEPTNSSTDGTLKLWIGTWSHQITKIEAESKSGSSEFSAMIEPKYNQKMDIVAPSTSISITELKSLIEELVSSFISPSAPTS